MFKKLKSGHMTADYMCFLEQCLQDRGYDNFFSSDRAYDVVNILGLKYVSLDTALKSFSDAMALTNDLSLGLDVGPRINIMRHGPLSQVLMSVHNSELFTKMACRYIKTCHSSLHLSSQQDNETLQLTLDIDLPKGELYNFHVDFVFSAMTNLAYQLTLQRKTVKKVTFSYPQPACIERYLKIFGGNVEFGAPVNSLYLDNHYLEKVFTNQRSSLLQLAVKQCDSLLKSMMSKDRTLDEIKAIMVEDEGSFPSQQALAAKLNMSSRSLSRRLEKYETNYRQLLQQCQKERAEYYLIETANPIDRIAELLGYDKAESFSRSFKNWTGVSPSEYRKERSKKTR